MSIKLKRVYEAPSRSDGMRILVERLWPRGISKERAAIALWLRDVAPSTALRKWFSHDPDRWDGFQSCYFAELDGKPEALAELRAHLRAGTVTFVFASKEEKLNNAVALKRYLTRRR